MEFYLPKDVARKVHCVEAALPEEVAMHSTLEKVTNFGTHCRVTAHTRIYVGRGLARYDVLVPPFGVFTFLVAGADPEDVSGIRGDGQGLNFDQIRYVYLVRSMEIEDSDNPEAHRVFLTAGDLLGGSERGSVAKRERESNSSTARSKEETETSTDRGTTRKGGLTQYNVDALHGHRNQPQSKTTRRIHEVGRHLGMVCSRLSLATMSATISDQVDKTTTPRESLL